jgi:hypothetical protein
MPGILITAGFMAWALAGWLIIGALNMGVEVYTAPNETVANLQLMHTQMLRFLMGAFALLNGTLLMIAGLFLGKDEPDPEG